MHPTLKILIIEDDAVLLTQITENITKTIVSFERQDIDIVVLEAESVKLALEAVRNDGDIQAVVFSWDVSTSWREIEVDRSGKVDNNAVVIDAIKNIRHELPVYVLGDAERGLEIVNDTRAMESFFYRNDIISDPESILGYIINDYDDRCDTPFWTAYRKYVVKLMTPGTPQDTVAVPASEIPHTSRTFMTFSGAMCCQRSLGFRGLARITL